MKTLKALIFIAEKLMLKCLFHAVSCYCDAFFFCTWEEEPGVIKYSKGNGIS